MPPPAPHHRPSPAPRWVPRALLRGLGGLYTRVLARKNRAFDAGHRVVTLDRPVVSVGNLSVGGTGKTPMVRWIVQRLCEGGRSPCIAMRGYARRGRAMSDEEALYAGALPGVPVVAMPDRTSGLLRLFASPEGGRVDCVVLDDGFQHRQLARQLDLVLIDASRDPFDDAPLPVGWLREPVESLTRAGAIVVTHGELVGADVVEALCRRLGALTGRAPIAITRHAWTGLGVHENGAERTEPVDWLAGRRVVVSCAIGHPGGFVREVERRCEVLGRLVLRDHDAYGPRRVRELIGLARRHGADAIVVTEKDWTKLARVGSEAWPCPVVRPALALGFDRGEGELGDLVLAATASRPG